MACVGRLCLISGFLLANVVGGVANVVRREPSVSESRASEVGANGAFQQVTAAKGESPIVIGSAELEEEDARTTVNVANASAHTHPAVAVWHLTGIENNANTFTKTAGNAAYDAEALTEHKNVVSIKVRPKQTDKDFRIGLSSEQFETADFNNGWFIGFYDAAMLYVPGWTQTQYSTENEYALIIKDQKVTFWINDVQEYEFPGAVAGPLFASLFIHDVGAQCMITEMAVSADFGNGDGAQTVVLANQGPNGPVGDAGPMGPPGVQGRHGDPGPAVSLEMLFQPAPAGPPGHVGEPGHPGSEGEPGIYGPQGAPGPVGQKGFISTAKEESWIKVIQELDEGIKKAADMDRVERTKLNARMNSVNKHLAGVEEEIVRQEAIEAAAEKAQADMNSASQAAHQAADTVATNLVATNEAAENVEIQAAETKNDVLNIIEGAVEQNQPTN